jgi:A/G-specific adenine glycosylase
MSAAVSAWFAENARELPWRVQDRGEGERPHAERGGAQGQERNPYHALVAEAMLQQTQVSRVVDKYRAFVARFPTVRSLADADEGDVLGMWTGLGYYRRARNLHAAAGMIVEEFGGRVPQEVEQLRRLPGVGRYTAGAIASIAFGERAPIVDGNVARVLLRVHGKDVASEDPLVRGWLWERAGGLVAAAKSPGVFNEGLMELGATVCTAPPGTPRCGECPVRGVCVARREGRQGEIPRAKARSVRKTIYCAVAVVERSDGSLLVERRGEKGMWAGMWQGPTMERADRAPTAAELSRAVGVPSRSLRPGRIFEFLATHRRVVVSPFCATIPRGFNPARGEFRSREEIAKLGLSAPQRRVLLGKD